MTELGAGGWSVSSTGGSPSSPVDLCAPRAGPPIQGKSRPARRTPATTIVDSSLSSVPIVLARSSAPSPSMRHTPQQEPRWSTTSPAVPVRVRPVGSGGQLRRQVAPVQDDQRAHRPGQDDVEAVQAPRVGGPHRPRGGPDDRGGLPGPGPGGGGDRRPPGGPPRGPRPPGPPGRAPRA